MLGSSIRQAAGIYLVCVCNVVKLSLVEMETCQGSPILSLPQRIFMRFEGWNPTTVGTEGTEEEGEYHENIPVQSSPIWIAATVNKHALLGEGFGQQCQADGLRNYDLTGKSIFP